MWLPIDLMINKSIIYVVLVSQSICVLRVSKLLSYVNSAGIAEMLRKNVQDKSPPGQRGLRSYRNPIKISDAGDFMMQRCSADLQKNFSLHVFGCGESCSHHFGYSSFHGEGVGCLSCPGDARLGAELLLENEAFVLG